VKIVGNEYETVFPRMSSTDDPQELSEKMAYDALHRRLSLGWRVLPIVGEDDPGRASIPLTCAADSRRFPAARKGERKPEEGPGRDRLAGTPRGDQADRGSRFLFTHVAGRGRPGGGWVLSAAGPVIVAREPLGFQPYRRRGCTRSSSRGAFRVSLGEGDVDDLGRIVGRTPGDVSHAVLIHHNAGLAADAGGSG